MEALIARSVQILIALGGAYILTLWFAIVIWTFQDIQARSRSVVAQIFSTLVVLIFSIPGLLIYLILRPRYTLDDAFQRSLEEEYLMQDLEELPLCPGCQQYVEDEWVFCPNCRTELRDNCIACDQLIDLRWEICPYCGTEQYESDDEALPAPIMQPVFAPSPQFLGRPQMTQTDVIRMQEVEQPTRPIIPATVRVDLRNGDVLTDVVPEVPISASVRPIDRLVEPRRVRLFDNGGTPDHSETDRTADEGNVSQPLRNEDHETDATLDPDTVAADESDNSTTEPESAISASPVEDSAAVESADASETESAQVSEVDGRAEDENKSAESDKPKKRRKRRRKPRGSGSDDS